jgi:capsular polysaccharide biosynthesis protein
MPPKKDADKNQKILDFNVGDEQPPWAKNMENRLSEKFDQVASSVAIL